MDFSETRVLLVGLDLFKGIYRPNFYFRCLNTFVDLGLSVHRVGRKEQRLLSQIVFVGGLCAEGILHPYHFIHPAATCPLHSGPLCANELSPTPQLTMFDWSATLMHCKLQDWDPEVLKMP